MIINGLYFYREMRNYFFFLVNRELIVNLVNREVTTKCSYFAGKRDLDLCLIILWKTTIIIS